MTFLEHLEYLREKKDKDLSSKEHENLPYDAKKVAMALKEPWKKNILNDRERVSFEDFRTAFSYEIIYGKKLQELTETDAEVLRLLGFKVGGKENDGKYTIYTTYSK